MKTIQRKLGGQTGASITFALLLFLVCAVASSVVIIAGSTAAGRMSEQAQTDQRYYAVASAVELLRNDFSNKTVTVTDFREGKTPNIDTDATVVSVTDQEYPLVVDVTEKLVSYIISDEEPPVLNLSLKADGVPEGVTLDCDINAYVKRDGRAIFQVSNTTVGTNAKKFTLTVTFTATISESKNTVGGITTHTTTVDWRLGDIRKGAI